MAKETKYGVISDVHADPRIVQIAIDVLKSLGAEKLLVNGDIGNQQETLEKSQQYVAFILDSIGKSGLESFVQPGSHETIFAYAPVIDHFSNKYHNIIDAIKNPVLDHNDHKLVFLPGSDFTRGGQYKIRNNIPTGDYYQTIHDELLPGSTDETEIQRLSEMGKLEGIVHITNMNDIKGLITEPDKTIVVCHVPENLIILILVLMEHIFQ
jgi:hypothetical protein